MADLKFFNDTHTYTFRGVRVPSVTQILQAEGFTHPYRGNSAANKGTTIHKATAAMDLWQRFDVPENLSGYMQAYLNWQNKHPMEFSHIEIPMVHEEKYFAGTPDRISTTGEVIDIKSGLKEPSHLIQSAGYMMLKPDLIKKRSCLYLHEDGTFEYIVHDDSADLRVFDAALYIYQWKQKAKEKKKK